MNSSGVKAVSLQDRAPSDAQLSGVSYRCNSGSILRDISLACKSGTTTFIFGPSGSGKTSIGLLLCGLLPLVDCPDALMTPGNRSYLSGEVTGERRLPSRAMYLPTDAESFFVYPNVADELASWFNDSGVSHEQMKSCLTDAGLAPSDLMQDLPHLSGGERQKVVLACVLAAQPDLLVLDENCGWLDIESQSLFRKCIDMTTARGGAAIILDGRRGGYGIKASREFVMNSGHLDDMPSSQNDEMVHQSREIPLLSTRSVRTEPAILRVADLLHVVRQDMGTLTFFSGLSFELHDGESLLITGPNGAGKSTLAKIIAGLDQPSQGRVEILSGDIRRLKARERVHRVGYLSQFPHHQLTLSSVGEELTRFAPNREVVNIIGVECDWNAISNRNPFGLNPFQQRSLLLAELLSNGPSVLILDEPTWGVDQAEAGKLAKMLRQLTPYYKALIVISHDLHFGSGICDYQLPIEKPQRGFYD